jgi:hypothetical protein
MRVHALQATTGPIIVGDAFVDAGSDFTIFRAGFVSMLGLRSFVHQMNHRWQGQDYPVRFGEVRLEIADAAGALIWPATVGFTDAPIPYGCLLGLSGFFEFLDVRFCGHRREIEAEPNVLFAGIGGFELA